MIKLGHINIKWLNLSLFCPPPLIKAPSGQLAPGNVGAMLGTSLPAVDYHLAPPPLALPLPPPPSPQTRSLHCNDDGHT